VGDNEVLRAAVGGIHVEKANILISNSFKEVQDLQGVKFFVGSLQALLKRGVSLEAELKIVEKIITICPFFTIKKE
jgi:hypothetical protein